MRRLLITIVALLLLGSAAAEDSSTESVVTPERWGVTLTCSARLPTAVVGCFAERPILAVGAFEVALGVDAQASLTGAAQGHLAPYLIAAWYATDWSAWAEVRLPELHGLHPLGDPDWLRLGFSLRL